MGRTEGEIVIARPVDVVFDYAGPGARYVPFRHQRRYLLRVYTQRRVGLVSVLLTRRLAA